MSLCPLCRTELSVSESDTTFYDDDNNELYVTLTARWCASGCGEYSKVRLAE